MTYQKYQANIDESPLIKYDTRLVALIAPSKLLYTLKLHGLYSVDKFIDPDWGDKYNLMPESTLSPSQGSMTSATGSSVSAILALSFYLFF